MSSDTNQPKDVTAGDPNDVDGLDAGRTTGVPDQTINFRERMGLAIPDPATAAEKARANKPTGKRTI